MISESIKLFSINPTMLSKHSIAMANTAMTAQTICNCHPNQPFVKTHDGFDAWTLPEEKNFWRNITAEEKTINVQHNGRNMCIRTFNFNTSPHHTVLYDNTNNVWKSYDPFCGPIALYTGVKVLRAGTSFINNVPKQLAVASYTQQMMDMRLLVEENQISSMLDVINADNGTNFSIIFVSYVGNRYMVHPLSVSQQVTPTTIFLVLQPSDRSNNNGHWVLGLPSVVTIQNALPLPSAPVTTAVTHVSTPVPTPIPTPIPTPVPTPVPTPAEDIDSTDRILYETVMDEVESRFYDMGQAISIDDIYASYLLEILPAMAVRIKRGKVLSK